MGPGQLALLSNVFVFLLYFILHILLKLLQRDADGITRSSIVCCYMKNLDFFL